MEPDPKPIPKGTHMIPAARKQNPLAVLSAILAYLCWGFFPLYWRLMHAIPAFAILSYRIIFALVFVLAVLAIRRELPLVRSLLKNPRSLSLLVLASILISVNWGLYIWAVNAEHVIETSFGYYINPLVSIVFGMVLFREKMGKARIAALLLAAVGVTVMAVDFGRLPLVALGLAFSFGSYGLVKKLLSAGALSSLALETLFSLPLALVGLFMTGTAADPALMGSAGWLLVALAGPVTALPLMFFGYSASRMPLSTLGFIQYLTPTITLLLGILVFGETFGAGRLAGFVCIWLALLVFSIDVIRANRKPVPADGSDSQ